MAVFKCKMCGATLNIEKDKNIIECEYCGTKQTVPVIKTKEIEELYDRANYFFHNNEYDKAASIYEDISTENPYDPESYFMLSLCKYGIEYVEDAKTKKRIPTLHRLHYESVASDINFKKAIKHADSTQKILYEQEAKYIDEVRDRILDISKKEKPYDVFICYKETDEKGQRTEDSVLAMDIYNEFIKEGLKVFFAKKTLESKLGIDYEPYIFAALNSAKVMVVVGTKPEYINSPWVRNEWTRFLDRINKNKSNKKSIDNCYIVPAYKGMSPYALPNEFNSVQAQDMTKVGAIQDLVDGVKKLINRSNEAKKTEVKSDKRLGKIVVVGIILIISLLIINIMKMGRDNERVEIRGNEYTVKTDVSTVKLEKIYDLNKNDIEKLKKIKSIKNLYFVDCTFENLNFLSELRNVKGVQFSSSTKVKDCRMKEICEHVENFKISGNSVTTWENIECIRKMPNLKELEVPLCKDLSPLSNHNKLIELTLFSNDKCNQVDSFLWCEGLENVEKLHFANYSSLYYTLSEDLFNGIENLSKLKNLKINGQTKAVSRLKKVDIEHISKLKELETIYISLYGSFVTSEIEKSDIIELKYLQEMTHLKNLHCSTLNYYDLNGIGNLTELEDIDLKGAYIYNENLNCLKGLNKLKSLAISLYSEWTERKTFSLNGIEKLTNLKNLIIRGNPNVELLDKNIVDDMKGLTFDYSGY